MKRSSGKLKRVDYLLKLKQIRKYLIDHPEGTTSKEITSRFHVSVAGLRFYGMASWKRVNGVVHWFAIDVAKSIAKELKDYEENHYVG